MKKYWYAIGMAVVLSTMIKVPASAEVDIDYSGVVRDYNGNNPNAQVDQSKMEVKLKDNVCYSGEQERYLYSISGITDRVSATVMDGMIVQEPVAIESGDKVKITLWRNGEKIDAEDMSAISDVGDYIVQAKNGNGNVENLFSFKIVGQEVNKLMEYRLPAHFAVKKVLYNEQPMETGTNTVSFTDEGAYTVEYQCTRNRKSYILNLVIDRTPPVLQLPGVENGKISGPVSLTDLEPNAVIEGTLNGVQIDLTGKQKLTASGRYEIQVSDAAGNSNVYKFTILIYLNSNSYVFIGFFLLIIVGIAVYLVISRKSLKVR